MDVSLFKMFHLTSINIVYLSIHIFRFMISDALWLSIVYVLKCTRRIIKYVALIIIIVSIIIIHVIHVLI